MYHIVRTKNDNKTIVEDLGYMQEEDFIEFAKQYIGKDTSEYGCVFSLINFVYDYPKEDLLNYSVIVIQAFLKRGYKFNMNNFNEYFGNLSWIECFSGDIFKEKMNERYLKQCLYNLQEKYDCGGISQKEWQKIEDKFGGVM